MTAPSDAAPGVSGGSGEPGAPVPGGGLEAPPNVYLPRAVDEPAYDGYRDPAAAHGWQSAYDETAELPVLSGGGTDAAGGAGGGAWVVAGGVAGGVAGEAAEPYDTSPLPVVVAPTAGAVPGAGRAAARRARKKRQAGRSRKAVVAAGAMGAVSLAAVIAGFSFSGSPSGGAREKDGRAGTSAGDPSAVSEEPSSAGASGAPSVTSAVPSATASPSAGAGSASGPASSPASAGGAAGTTKSGDTASTGSGTTATSTATATASTVTGPGNSGRGHGRGGGTR